MSQIDSAVELYLKVLTRPDVRKFRELRRATGGNPRAATTRSPLELLTPNKMGQALRCCRDYLSSAFPQASDYTKPVTGRSNRVHV